MSEPGEEGPRPSPVVSGLMIFIGIILLIPGACAGYFAAMSLGSRGDDYLSLFIPLWVLCFLVAAGGVALLVWGFRRLNGGRRKD
jgi:hypothetical protein